MINPPGKHGADPRGLKLTALHFTDALIDQVRRGAPLSAAERQFLETDTLGFEENHRSLESLKDMTDAQLMDYAYSVWSEYARTQG